MGPSQKVKSILEDPSDKNAFKSTVRNLLRMKPKPHKEKGEAGTGDEPKPAPGSDEQKSDLHQQKNDVEHGR